MVAGGGLVHTDADILFSIALRGIFQGPTACLTMHYNLRSCLYKILSSLLILLQRILETRVLFFAPANS